MIYFLIILILTDSVNSDPLEELQNDVKRISDNIEQIFHRLKGRLGQKGYIHCIAPSKNSLYKQYKQLIINACKLEIAFNAMKFTIGAAKKFNTSIIIEIAKDQVLDAESLIHHIESILNF